MRLRLRSLIIKIKNTKDRKIRHGDVIRDVEYLEHADIKDGIIDLSIIEFPLVVVLTQDCDLAQDYKFRWSRAEVKNEDKYLLSVLVAPMYNYEHVIKGEHLSEIEMGMTVLSAGSATLIQKIQDNEIPRYHYLEFPSSTNIVPTIIDFKHYFSVPTKYLKSHKANNFECQIAPVNREDLQQRFSSFLSRIALPD